MVNTEVANCHAMTRRVRATSIVVFRVLIYNVIHCNVIFETWFYLFQRDYLHIPDVSIYDQLHFMCIFMFLGLAKFLRCLKRKSVTYIMNKISKSDMFYTFSISKLNPNVALVVNN